MSEPQLWQHSAADLWSSGLTPFNLAVGPPNGAAGDAVAPDQGVKIEKTDTGYGDGYGPPPGSSDGGYAADPAAFYSSMYPMPHPSSNPMMQHQSDLEEQIKRDKEAIYAHPLYPLLVVLFEKCELATSTPREQSRDGSSSSDVCSSSSFKDDLADFVRHTQESADKAYYVPNPQLDGIMLQAIQMLRFHLLELEKVHELCDNFCNRYVTCLKSKMPNDIVGDERASSSQPPMSPTSGGGHSASPSMGGGQTPMSHFPPPYEPQSVPLPENSGIMSHSMEGSSMGYPGMSAHSLQTTNSQPTDHPLAIGGAPPTTAGAPQTLPLAAVSSPSACSSSGGLRHDSTPLSSGDTPGVGGHANGNPSSLDSISEAGDEFSLCGSNEDGRESVLSDGANGSVNGSNGAGKRKVPKVFSKEAITKFRAWLFQNLSHPYPSEEQKKQLANETGLTILQVNNWFINARRRIVQPMIDQNNRAGRMPTMNVFKNRRRNRSEHSPGPSPDSDLGANYSPDPAAAAAISYPGPADLYNMQRSMFNGYPPFPTPAMPFMNPMMGFQPGAGQPLSSPWAMDPGLLSQHME